MLRILHTADWHLGKMLGDLSREQEHQLFLDFLLTTIREEKVDVLLISGDVFDSSNPPQSAVAQYYQFLSALHQSGSCQAIITAGNHDSPAHIEAPRDVLKVLRTQVIGVMPTNRSDAWFPLPDARSPQAYVAAVPFLRDRDLRTGISGQSSSEIQAALNDSIAAIYEEMASLPAEKNTLRIAMGHLTVSGSTPSDSEREIHVGGLGALPVERFPDAFDYIALGHLHRPQSCGARDTVRYSGSPIPLSFSECRDHKELRLIEIHEGTLTHRAIPIPLTRTLRQVKVTQIDLEKTLVQLATECTQQHSLLTPWIELIITDPMPGDNVAQRCAELTKHAPYQIVRVIQQNTVDIAVATWDQQGDPQQIDDLLANPATLFQCRLDQEPNLSDEQKTSLQQTFAALLALHRNE